MNESNITPSWVQPVDGATCAALSRELWAMLSAAGADSSAVDFCDYVTSATLAFQREYAAAEWGETHDWMEETERHLARYLREFPIRALEDAGVRHADPLPVTSPVYALDDEAISYAVRLDALAESGGREVAVALARADIPHINYGSGIVEVLSADLRVRVCLLDRSFADVHIVRLMDDGHTDYYDEVAEGIPLDEVVEVVRGVLAKVRAE